VRIKQSENQAERWRIREFHYQSEFQKHKPKSIHTATNQATKTSFFRKRVEEKKFGRRRWQSRRERLAGNVENSFTRNKGEQQKGQSVCVHPRAIKSINFRLKSILQISNLNKSRAQKYFNSNSNFWIQKITISGMHTNFLLLITHKLQITLHSYKTSFRLQRNLQSSELHGYHPSMIASIREIADKQYPKLILKFSVEITATISNRINSSRTTVVHVIVQHHHQVFQGSSSSDL